MINGKNIFDQPIKNDIKTYDNIRKITTGQGDDYTTGCLLDYNYFIKHYKMIIEMLIYVNNKHLMLIEKLCNKLILLKI